MKRLRLTPTRLAWAALVIGVATYGVVWVATYKTLTAKGRLVMYGLGPQVKGPPQLYASPIWTIPAAALITISAAGALLLILRRR